MARKKLPSAAPHAQAEVLDLDYGSADTPATKPLSRQSSPASKSPETTRQAGPSTSLLDMHHSIDVEPQMYARRAPSAYETDEHQESAQSGTAVQQGGQLQDPGQQGRPESYHYPQPPLPQPPVPPPPEWQQGQSYVHLPQHLHGPYMPHMAPSNEADHPWVGAYYAHPSAPLHDPQPPPPPMLPPYIQHPPPPPPPPQFTYSYEHQQQGHPSGGMWPQQNGYMHFDGHVYSPMPYDPYYPASSEQPWPPQSMGSMAQHPQMHTLPVPPPLSHLPSEPSPGLQPIVSSPDAKRLSKKLKRQRKKQAKRERQQQSLAELNAASPLDGSTAQYVSQDVAEPDHLEGQKKFRLVNIFSHLRENNVPPLRLLDFGLSRSVLDACCAEAAEAGISASGPTEHSSPTKSPKAAVSMTAAEEHIMTKDEEGKKLTPLEELRKKALESRLAKAAAAKAQAEAEADNTVQKPPLAPVEEWTLRYYAGLLQAMRGPATNAEAPVSHKRAYKDIDAAEETDAAGVDVYMMGDDSLRNSPPPPAQRQRISYADSFAVKPQAPKGDVDMNAPVPSLPEQSATGTSPHTQSKRARPVAADFSEAYPTDARAKRFLDVPHGLNTVVDISDDENESDHEAPSAVTQHEQKSGLSAEQTRQLQKKTGDELNAIYRALNGLSSIPEPSTRALAKSHGDDDALPSLDMQGKGQGSTSDSREDLIRKELEIQALTRRIQLRESQRKTKPGSSAKPFSLDAEHGSAALAAPTLPITPSPELLSTNNKPLVSSSAAVQLDPALQKQRQALLELLASNRRNKPNSSVKLPASAKSGKQPAAGVSGTTTDTPTVFDLEADPHGPVGTASMAADESASHGIVRFDLSKQGVLSVNASENGYRPYFPTLLQTMANKFKTRFLPSQISMRFRQTAAASAGPSEGKETQPQSAVSAEIDVNKRWCLAESNGAECQNPQCSMIHASDLDPETEP